jgi:hypothetical protein
MKKKTSLPMKYTNRLLWERIYLPYQEDKVSIFSKKEGKVYDLDYHYVNPLFNGLFKTSQDQKNPKLPLCV